MDPNSFSKKSTSQMIVEYILDQIQSGNIKKGDRIMTEHEFSELLGVSRVPIREALCVLSTVGLLEARQGGGRYVTNEYNTDILGHMLYDYAILEDVSLVQTMDVRFLLEPEIARKAAVFATPEQRKHIWEISTSYCVAANSYSGTQSEFRDIIAMDHDFHQSIAEASKNPFLSMLFAIITYSFEAFQHRRYERGGDHQQHWQTLSIEHLDIAKAILAQDGGSAYQAMTRHLQLIRYDIGWGSEKSDPPRPQLRG